MKQTVETGENNSVVLCGPRGSGKSSIISTVLNSLRSQNHEIIEIYLNGIVHTDEKSALKTMLKQLNIPGHETISSFVSFFAIRILPVLLYRALLDVVSLKCFNSYVTVAKIQRR